MKTSKNRLGTTTSLASTVIGGADSAPGGTGTVVGAGGPSTVAGGDTIVGGTDMVAGSAGVGTVAAVGNAAGVIEERSGADGTIISERDFVEAVSQIDATVSVKEIGEARDPLDEARRLERDRIYGIDPARNDLTSGTGPDFTDGKPQPHLVAEYPAVSGYGDDGYVTTIVGRDPIVAVADGRPRGSPTNNPADAAIDPGLIGDDADGFVECLRVEPTADRRRAGRRFRKGRVEHLPLDRITPAERRMIEADPMLSTRIERVDPLAAAID